MQLQPLKSALRVVREHLEPHAPAAIKQTADHFGRKPKLIIFLSASNTANRALCACGIGNTLDSCWKAAFDKLRKRMPDEEDWQWIKVDLVWSIKPHQPRALIERVAKTRRNFFRHGISFDPDFNAALLEQELNGIGGIGFDDDRRLILRFDRINRHLRTSRGVKELPPEVAQRDTWYTFETKGVFYDRSDPAECVYPLIYGGYGNGIRQAPIAHDTVTGLIEQAGLYLARQLRDDGSFHYGFFPVGHEAIPTYNILRHSGTLYSMLEAWEAVGNDTIAAGVPRGIELVLREALRPLGAHAVVADHANKGEIRLGAQAVFILAVAKYTKLTGDRRYLDAARQIGRAIIDHFLDSRTGQFVHVLDGSDFSVKDTFRIIFYDGEAVLALLRLYELDSDPVWLKSARLAFAYFLRVDHWRHFDHWQAYATAEITRHDPDRRYVEFGLKNALCNLDFIHQRDTAFPTFLELLMATLEMIETTSAAATLNSTFMARLLATAHHRAGHLRYSHFYPELAMYFRKPRQIAGSFFIRHHGFRIRIDDVEHFISGYCMYRRFCSKHGDLGLPV